MSNAAVWCELYSAFAVCPLKGRGILQAVVLHFDAEITAARYLVGRITVEN